jgi:hypothetical protein
MHSGQDKSGGVFSKYGRHQIDVWHYSQDRDNKSLDGSTQDGASHQVEDHSSEDQRHSDLSDSEMPLGSSDSDSDMGPNKKQVGGSGKTDVFGLSPNCPSESYSKRVTH